MPSLIEHEIEGSLQHANDFDISQQKLVVHAIVEGSEVAKADVDSSGRYKIHFQHEEEKPLTELRVTPSAAPENASNLATEIIQPASFVREGNLTVARQDLQVVSGPKPFPPKLYSMFGQVFARTGHTIEPLASAKLHFEVFFPMPTLVPGAPPTWQKIDLGNCLTGPDGKYLKTFLLNLPFYPPNLLKGSPYLHVQISQLVMGVEYKLLSETLGLPEIGHYDFLVDVSKSTVCFTFKTFPLGLTTNPLTVANAKPTVFDYKGNQVANSKIEQRMQGANCLHCDRKLVIDLPFPSTHVQITVRNDAQPTIAQAFDVGGLLIASDKVGTAHQLYTLQLLSANGIKQVVLTSPSDEAWLFDMCY